MLRYGLRRVLRMILSLIAISLITFSLLQVVPGTFRDLAAIGEVGSTVLGDQGTGQVDLEQLHGEAAPAWEQYLTVMKGFFTWDIGPTFRFPQTTVEQLIAEALPVSLALAVPAIILALLIAVPIGVLAAVRKDRPADYASMFTLTTLQALPGYLFALILILILAVWLGALDTRGWSEPSHLIIPVLALAVQPTALLARFVRASMLEALREEYVVAAYAKGGTRRTVLTRHVLRNSLIPLVTVVGPIFAGLATGVVFIESLLSIPGLGRLFVVAARTRDMPLLMGTTLFFALILMLINLIVDMTYGMLDPRIRHHRAERRPRPAAGASTEPVDLEEAAVTRGNPPTADVPGGPP